MATTEQNAQVSFLIPAETTNTVGPADFARFKIVHQNAALADLFITCRFVDGTEELVRSNSRFATRYGASIIVTSQNPSDLCYTTELMVRRVGRFQQNFSMVVKAVDSRPPVGTPTAGVVAVRVVSPCGPVQKPDAVVLELDDVNDVVRSYNIVGSYDGIDKFPIFTSESGFFPGFRNNSVVRNRYFEDLYPNLTYNDTETSGPLPFDTSNATFFDKHDFRLPKSVSIKPDSAWKSSPIITVEALRVDGKLVTLTADGRQDQCATPVDR